MRLILMLSADERRDGPGMSCDPVFVKSLSSLLYLF